jgi:hypothetical protein
MANGGLQACKRARAWGVVIDPRHPCGELRIGHRVTHEHRLESRLPARANERVDDGLRRPGQL